MLHLRILENKGLLNNITKNDFVLNFINFDKQVLPCSENVVNIKVPIKTPFNDKLVTLLVKFISNYTNFIKLNKNKNNLYMIYNGNLEYIPYVISDILIASCSDKIITEDSIKYINLFKPSVIQNNNYYMLLKNILASISLTIKDIK